MNLLALNDDVLTNIVSFLGCRDALSLSATSRHIHDIAKRRVHTTVELRYPAQTPLFCAYMLADVPNRAQRLQSLTVTSAYTDAVHYLVSRLELPNVTAVSYEFLYARSGTLLEHLLPHSLATASELLGFAYLP